MFYAIPLENKPTWRNPPWITLLLILLNMAVFWGPQRSETRTQQQAAHFYLGSALPALELPPFVAWLKDVNSPYADQAEQAMQARSHNADLLEAMENEPRFLARLRADQVITPAHPQHASWKRERQRYEALQPAPFTTRWSQSYNKEDPLRPWTWLSNTFLHGSTSHLLGNMVFLFLFGFSVELALGHGTYLVCYLIGAVGASLLAGWAYAGNGGYGLGASGAISALMAMYAVMYRLKRIRFFYQLFFYFNYVTAPALLLLPAWIINEMLQHLVGGRGIAYMAHLGGLLSGATLMAAALHFRKLAIPITTAETADAVDPFDTHVASAMRLAGQMRFDAACVEWRAAARLRKQDANTLRAWFNTAKLAPASDDFHHAARSIFQLTSQDPATLELQHQSYKTYLTQAKPGIRLNAQDMVNLVSRFTRARQFEDAEKLCRAMLKSAPEHPRLGDTMSLLANGLLQAGERDRARQWLPHLQRLAPNDMLTRVLQQG